VVVVIVGDSMLGGNGLREQEKGDKCARDDEKRNDFLRL